MKTAAIYARYSSNSQTEQSIEGQLDVCNKYAKDNDLQVVATYIDRAMTGTNDNRPDFQRMLKDSEKSSWDAVLVYITCSVYKSFDTDEACRTRTAFNLKSELETSNNSFKTVIDR